MAEKKAAIWARVSTDHQTEANQMPDLERFCAHRSYEITRRYLLSDVSAYNGAHRETLRQVLDDAYRGEFQVLVVWAVDRICREGSGRRAGCWPSRTPAAARRSRSAAVRPAGTADPWKTRVAFGADALHRNEVLPVDRRRMRWAGGDDWEPRQSPSWQAPGTWISPSGLPVIRATAGFVGGFSFALWAFGTWWIPPLIMLGLWRQVRLQHGLASGITGLGCLADCQQDC
jgi:hypothetical protein